MRELSRKADDFSPQTLHLWLDEAKIEQVKEHTVRKVPHVSVSSHSHSMCAADLNNIQTLSFLSDVRFALRPLPANTRQI